jgi:hypothetical protein
MLVFVLLVIVIGIFLRGVFFYQLGTSFVASIVVIFSIRRFVRKGIGLFVLVVVLEIYFLVVGSLCRVRFVSFQIVCQ